MGANCRSKCGYLRLRKVAISMLQACQGTNFHEHSEPPKGRGGEWWERCEHVVLDDSLGYQTVDVRDVVDNEDATEAYDVSGAHEPPNVDPGVTSGKSVALDVSGAHLATSDSVLKAVVANIMNVTHCKDSKLVLEVYSRCVGTENERLNKACEIVNEEIQTMNLIESEKGAGGAVEKRTLRSSGSVEPVRKKRKSSK